MERKCILLLAYTTTEFNPGKKMSNKSSLKRKKGKLAHNMFLLRPLIL